MSNLLSEIFTIDNALHALVALVVVALGLVVGIFSGITWLVLLAAAIATVGLYVRELLQVKAKQDIWSFTLLGSFHKNMEWAVGSFAAWVAALVIFLVF